MNDTNSNDVNNNNHSGKTTARELKSDLVPPKELCAWIGQGLGMVG